MGTAPGTTSTFPKQPLQEAQDMQEPTIEADPTSPIMTEERKARCTALFARIDTDGDGKLSREELQKVFGPLADDVLKGCDTDADGAISLEEWCTFLCKSHDDEFNHRVGYISERIAQPLTGQLRWRGSQLSSVSVTLQLLDNTQQN